MKQAGLRKGRGARDQIANVSESWTVQRSTTKMSNCFIDYTKDFDFLSPGLFNLHSHYIIKMGGVGDMETGTGKVI